MNDDTECPGCGSSLKDRQDYVKRNNGSRLTTSLRRCPHCGSQKCCMCDMGDDVECLSCDKEPA